MAGIVELLKIIFSVNQAELDKFVKSLDTANKSSEDLKKKQKELGENGGKATDPMVAGLDSIIKGAKAFLALSLVQEFAALAENASKVAAAGEGIRNAFRNLGGTKKDLEELSKAAGGTVSNIKLMELSVKAFQKGLNPEQTKKFFEYLNKQTSATGGDFKQLGEKMLKSMDGVPKLMSDISTKTKQLGESADGASEAYGRLEAAQDNATEAFGRFVNSPGYLAWVQFKADSINAVAGLFGAADLNDVSTEDLLKRSESLSAQINSIKDLLDVQSQSREIELRATKEQVDQILQIRINSEKKIREGNKEAFAKSIKEQGDAAKSAIADQDAAKLEEQKKTNQKLIDEEQKTADKAIELWREYYAKLNDTRQKATIEQFNKEKKAEIKTSTKETTKGIEDSIDTFRNSLFKKLTGQDETKGKKAGDKIPGISNDLKETTEKVKVDFQAAAAAAINIVDAFTNLSTDAPVGKKIFAGVQAILGALSFINPAFGVAAAGVGAIGRFANKNEGGWIPGGGPDRDSVPAMLTPGEFVTRRRSAQASPLLLDAINAGEISDKDFLKIINPQPMVVLNQDQVVAAIERIPQVDLYKSGSALYEVKTRAKENSVNRRRRLMP